MVDREKQWERVQIKGFTAWINSYLGPKGLAVENLQTDLTNGVRLCTFVENIRDRSQDAEVRKTKLDRWEQKPSIRLHYIHNVNSAMKFIRDSLKVKLVAIGAEDIVDANVKYILGLLWSVFRKIRSQDLGAENEKDEEMALLKWVKEQTDGYKDVEIKGWKDSWGDGLALNALIHKFDPSLVDYDSLNKDNQEENLKNAFTIAEQKLGIPQLLEAEELIKNNPDERSVIFYISLFFHAFVANEEKRRLMAATRETQNKVVDLKTQLEEEARRRKEAEDLLEKLRKELEELKTRLRMNELLHKDDSSLYEEKIRALKALLEEEGADKADQEEKARRLRAELEEAERAREELEELRKRLQAEGSSLYDELQKAEEEKRRLRAELDDLKKKIKAEIEKRKSRARAAAELEAENAALKRQAVLQGKARSGLEVLKRNLEEHLEDMYHWRQLHQLDVDQAAPEVFDLQKVLDQLNKKSFEDQLDILNGKLQGENLNLQRIIRLKDKDAELRDAVDKQGWLEIRGVGKSKDWKKFWFVLRGPTLTYYKKEDDDRASGTVPLADAEFVDVKKEDKEFVIGIRHPSAADKVIQLAAPARKEKDEWRAILGGAVVHVKYLDSIEKQKEHRPDTRLINLLKSVDVNNVYLDGAAIKTEEINALVLALAGVPELDTLSLSNASLSDADVATLAKGLTKVNVRILKLSNNKITSKGAEAVAKVASSVSGLVELHLDGNQIGDSGTEALAAVLGKDSKVTYLNLNNNRVGDKGAAAFGKALASTSAPLKAVQFGSNEIGDAGASAIADALANKHTASQVNLSKNKVGDAGAVALAKAFGTNDSVTELDLSENNLSTKGAVALRDALKSGKSLRKVELSGNKNIQGGSDLAAAFGDNFTFPALSLVRKD